MRVEKKKKVGREASLKLLSNLLVRSPDGNKSAHKQEGALQKKENQYTTSKAQMLMVP